MTTDTSARLRQGMDFQRYDLGRVPLASRHVLEQAGFEYDARLGVWLNTSERRAIAYRTVMAYGPDWVAEWVLQA